GGAAAILVLAVLATAMVLLLPRRTPEQPPQSDLTAADALWEKHLDELEDMMKQVKSGAKAAEVRDRCISATREFDQQFDAMPLSDDERKLVYDRYGKRWKTVTDPLLRELDDRQ